MAGNRRLIAVIAIQLAAISAMILESPAADGVEALRCEYQVSPLGIDTPVPRLSWQIASVNRGIRQSAYQVLVASDPDLLAQNKADLWDTGKVMSEQTHLIPYAGKSLISHQPCFWKVRTWTSDGGEMESGIANWTMGFLSPDEWRARWIGMPKKMLSPNAKWIWSVPQGKKRGSLPPGPCRLQRTFELPKDAVVAEAELMVTADNSAKAALNGEPVAETTDWEQGKVLQVKDRLVAGANTLDVMAVNAGSRNGPAGMICQLRVELENGKEILIVSDKQWVGALGETSDTLSPATEIAPWGKGPWGENAFFEVKKEAPEKGLPVFRKTFTVGGNLKKALVNVSGLGHYELFVNGQKAGDRFLAPAWSVYEKTVYYNTYDITGLLKGGINEFRIMLGKGFYKTLGDRRTRGRKANGALMAILEARLDYADGTTDTVITDDSWDAAAGPVLHSSILAGSDFDARLAEPAIWSKARETIADGTLTASESPSMKKFERLVPIKSAEEPEPGIFIYDFGQNLSAISSITMRGQKGKTLRLSPAEQRHGQKDRHNNGTGRVNQAGVGKPNYYEYTLGGSDSERWEPQFTYGGFQYLELTGAVPAEYPNPNDLPVVEKIESVHVRSSVEEVGAFACSNPLFMQIDQSIDRAVRSNLAHVLTDCPTREKLGWLEVAYLMGPSISRRYDVSRLYAKVTNDIRDSQEKNGAIKTVAPNYPKYGGAFGYTPEWGAAGVIVPWQLYRWYGDKRVLQKNLSSMKGFVDYMNNTSTDLVPKAGLGDWFDYGHGKKNGPAKFTPPELTAMATFYRCAVIVAKTAELLGEKENAQNYQALADEIRIKFNEEFYIGNGQYKNHGSCQTANAMALVCGLVEPENGQSVLDEIVADLEKRNFQQTAGDIGFHYLVEALATFGKNEVLNKSLNRREEGSYGFIIDRGWTALPEAWDAQTHASMNHCMLGHAQQWFYADVLGIRQEDDSVGFRKTIIKPAVETELEWAEGYYDSVSGRISVDWKKDDGRLVLNVGIPANTTASIYLPAKETTLIRESGKPVDQVNGVTFLRMENGLAVLEVGSGKYEFVSVFE